MWLSLRVVLEHRGDEMTRTSHAACPDKHYCTDGKMIPGPFGSFTANGKKFLCPEGTYGKIEGEVRRTCSGSCKDGFHCPPGSKSEHEQNCEPGSYCVAGLPYMPGACCICPLIPVLQFRYSRGLAFLLLCSPHFVPYPGQCARPVPLARLPT